MQRNSSEQSVALMVSTHTPRPVQITILAQPSNLRLLKHVFSENVLIQAAHLCPHSATQIPNAFLWNPGQASMQDSRLLPEHSLTLSKQGLTLPESHAAVFLQTQINNTVKLTT